ncbi:MAG: DUF4386 family protein [Curvibacter sp.]|nr:MAG: DUF4386 family protein [Curvibacter sp.]
MSGLLYFGVVLTGLFTLMYVPSKLIVPDDASLTYNNIVTSQTLFRLGIVGGLLCYTFFLFLPLVELFSQRCLQLAKSAWRIQLSPRCQRFLLLPWPSRQLQVRGRQWLRPLPHPKRRVPLAAKFSALTALLCSVIWPYRSLILM